MKESRRDVPAGLEDLGTVYSNFDHVLEKAIAEKLALGGSRASHAAWDFNGIVWFEDGVWFEKINRYQHHETTLEGATLEEVLSEANGRFGSS
jgi:hypothetical protein